MEKNIYIQRWLDLKPYDKQTSTDFYYLKLSNETKKVLISDKSLFQLEYLDEDEIDLLSCFLVSYFEDIISETNIWNSFTNVHNKLYDKRLPFYNTDDYYESEINVQDICFLIWYFLNTEQEKVFISPYNDFIVQVASLVMPVFEKEYEYAPVNENIKQFYQIDENETDYYKARELIGNILFASYLFYTDTSFRLTELETELLAHEDEERLTAMLLENRDSFLHKLHTRLLSLKGKEWAAEVLGSTHPLYDELHNISQRIVGFFLYKGQDDHDILIEHIASGKQFKLTKESFDFSSELKLIDTIMFLGIVRWRNMWWFSGIYFHYDFNPDIILDEKNSIESRMQVSFLDHDRKDTNEVLKSQLDAFLSINNDSPIAFLPAAETQKFMEEYIAYYNHSLNLTKKDREQSKERAKREGFLAEKDNISIDLPEDSEAAVLFFNPNSGLEVAFDCCSAFPIDTNIYFKDKESEADILRLLMSEEISKELAVYCIDNFKNQLAFFKENPGKSILDDIDFLLRFWKKEAYHSQPSIAFTGLNEKPSTHNK